MKTQKTVTFYKEVKIEYCYILQCNSRGMYKYRHVINDVLFCSKTIEEAEIQIDAELEKLDNYEN